MQLIELIFITLTSFAVLILIVLIFSYFGYKTRKKVELKDAIVTKELNSFGLDDEPEHKIANRDHSSHSNKSQKHKRFTVFNPGLNNSADKAKSRK